MRYSYTWQISVFPIPSAYRAGALVNSSISSSQVSFSSTESFMYSRIFSSSRKYVNPLFTALSGLILVVETECFQVLVLNPMNAGRNGCPTGRNAIYKDACEEEV